MAFGFYKAGEDPESARRRANLIRALSRPDRPQTAMQGIESGVGKVLAALTERQSMKADVEARERSEAQRMKLIQAMMGGEAGLDASSTMAPPQQPSQQPTHAQQPPVSQDALVQAVMQRESAGNPNAVSPKGAMGLMQLMPGTARDPGFGVEGTSDPFNPQENMRVGSDYLNAMKSRYQGDLPRALAAYNWGPGNADKWDGRMESLPDETRAYVQNIMGDIGQAAPQQAQQAQPQQAGGMSPAIMMGMLSDDPAVSRIAQAMFERNAPPEPMNDYQRAQLGLSQEDNALARARFQQEIEQSQSMTPYQREQIALEKKQFAAEQEQRAAAERQALSGYGTYVQQEVSAGREPLGILEYQERLKQASRASNNVTVNSGGSSELRKKFEGKEGEQWAAYQDQGSKASSIQGDLEVLGQVLEEAPTGPLTGRLAEQFPGFSDSSAVFESIVKRLAPQMRAPGSGSTSDVEYGGMLKSLPQLLNNPEANRAILSVMQAKSNVDLERSNIVTQWANGSLGDAEARTALSELNSRSIMSPELKRIIKSTGGGAEQQVPGEAAAAEIPPMPPGIEVTEGDWPALWESMPPEDRALFQ